MTARAPHNISLPATTPHSLDQDEAYFLLKEGSQTLKLRFHDYGEIYRRPGLYEQLFYQRLQCTSPEMAHRLLVKVLQHNHEDLARMRVLDLGAGNGMVGELLDAARVVGVDILTDARDACERDRPGAYDAYYVADMCELDPHIETELRDWQFDALTCVAALGFGDIPVDAFIGAYNMVQNGGWIAFNIKDAFMQASESTGFASLTHHLLQSDAFELHHLERYRHRISIDGRPLYYCMTVGRKCADIAPAMWRRTGSELSTSPRAR